MATALTHTHFIRAIFGHPKYVQYMLLAYRELIFIGAVAIDMVLLEGVAVVVSETLLSVFDDHAWHCMPLFSSLLAW
ncbi:hypothetical protein E2562_010124 [Oryza meyeriana var. granulata]|uniref:Uncharacterized protein n=1 Tax=Oryza meyeriana var. granulata TaxID=110450 RepID=A0A6G1EHC4_9ORYZ|nr:hypothetical protein E2562_010124 [Oryza meyeriana var. granulata]